MASSVPGVYAAGDICDYPGKVRLIATGFGEVATAVNNAVAFIDPQASVNYETPSDVDAEDSLPVAHTSRVLVLASRPNTL